MSNGFSEEEYRLLRRRSVQMERKLSSNAKINESGSGDAPRSSSSTQTGRNPFFKVVKHKSLIFPIKGDKNLRSALWDERSQVHVVDRNPDYFEPIFMFYQDGVLERPSNIPLERFVEEIKFYGLQKQAIGENEVYEDDIAEDMSNFRCRARHYMANPTESKIYEKISKISLFMTSLSILTLCFDTLPVMHKDINFQFYEATGFIISKTSTAFVFFIVEVITNLFFLAEISFIIFIAKDRQRKIRSPSIILDQLAIAPFVVESISSIYYIFFSENGDEESINLNVLRIVRLFRIFRVIKLSKNNESLCHMIKTMGESTREISFLLILLAISGIFYGSVIYQLENATNEKFSCIPDGIWWAIITMSTIGYGDLYPTTAGGRIVGCCCALSGVLSFALPVPAIIHRFQENAESTRIDGKSTTDNALRRRFATPVQ